MRRVLVVGLAGALLAGCGGSNQSAATTLDENGCRTVDHPKTGERHESKPTQKLDPSKTYRLTFATNCGDFTVQLATKTSPNASASFVSLARKGFFDKTIFHRIVPGFVIQGGGLDAQFRNKRTHAPIRNEAKNGLKNTRGTLSMARTSEVDSATSQFFVNLSDNAFLDHSARDFGYAVFGRVTEGMDVVDKIAAVKTGRRQGYQDAPLEDVVIVSASRSEAQTQ